MTVIESWKHSIMEIMQEQCDENYKKGADNAAQNSMDIYLKYHPCNCKALTEFLKPCLSCRVALEMWERRGNERL